MKKIIVYNNWGDTPQHWIKRISKQSPTGSRWKDIQLVSDIRDSDIVIICDGLPNLSRDEFEIFLKKDKIYLQREPDHVQGSVNIDKSKVLKAITYESYHPYVDWYVDMDYNTLSKIKISDYNKDKKNPICVISNKAFTDGQRKRLAFLEKIQHLVEIDFYGQRQISNRFKNYCGPIEFDVTEDNLFNPTGAYPYRDKSRIFQYKVSISLENGKQRNFFTRTSEDLLCWALPVYWGCPNLQDYFPENSYRHVDIEKEDFTKEQIKFLLRDPEEKELKALAEARELILNKYNFFPYISNILKDI